MTRFRLALLAALALTLAGCASSYLRPTVYDDPTIGRRCLEFALAGCLRYDRSERYRDPY